MKGHLKLLRRLLSILCALVLLNAGTFSACADDKKLPVEDEGVIAVDDLFNTEDQEEKLTIVVSDEEQEERKEEQPDESADSIGSGNENSPKTSNPAVESELSEGENQPEKSNDLLAEDDEIKTDQEEENEQQEEKGQENDQTDGQEETAAAEIKEKPEEFVTTEVTLSPLKRSDLTEDKQEKKEEPQTEESLLRNTKGTVGYTVAVWIEDNPTVKSGSYCIFAYVGETEYKHTITGSAETALSIPERPNKIFIADPNGRTIDELQALNSEYYLVSEPEFDEENRKYTFNLKKRIECRMQFQSLSDDLQLSGKYYIVAKRKRSGTPVACASIDKGKTDGFDQKNIYNDSTFVIYKIDEFIFDYYKRNPGYYSKFIVEPGQATENGVVFSWSSEPKLVNYSYVYYIYCGKKKEIETEEVTEHSNVTVTSKDQDGVTLNEAEFKLYAESACTTEIKSCTGGCFTISTDDMAIGNYLPTETGTSNARTLYLKETKVPAGYEIDDGSHSVIITKSIIEQLDEAASKKTITTSYGITIDGKSAADITNTRLTKEERIDGSITVTAKDQDGAALNGLAFGLYLPQECGEDTEIATYSEQSFTISTGLDTLASHLPVEPGADHATTLYLKQTVGLVGFNMDTTVHPVVITKAICTELVQESNVYTFVTTITYEIMIDNKNAIDITNSRHTKEERIDGSITVTAKDQDRKALSGSTFGLYSSEECGEDTEIATYSEQSFTISTGSEALKSYLPTEIGPENATTLYLKQTAAPVGYDADTAVHSVVITKAVSTDLVEVSNVYLYVTTTTYGIVIDGKNAIDIMNTKRTDEKRTDGSVVVTAKDQDGAALNGLTFGLYTAQECVENTKIATFSEQSFAISTGLDALASHLPTGTGSENATTLYLKQTTPPAGYDADTAVHSVVITKTVKTDLVEESNMFVTTTAYGITIDGKSAVVITNQKRTGTDRKDGTITIINKDDSGNELSGSSFGLYSDASGSTAAIDNYTGGRFTISTNGTALTNCLPTETGTAHARTLYLKETEVPAGYDKETVVHTVVITKSIDTYFDNTENKYITRTTYGITVDGGSTIDIENTKRTDEKRTDGSVVVTAKDQDGAALNGLTFGLYLAQECAKNTQIATFGERSFAISTTLDALTSHLPTETGSENVTTLYLKQTTAPAGYDADTAVHSVVITKTVKTDLVEESNTYVTTTAYGITIDGKSAVDIINRKRTGTDRKDGSITITNKDDSGNELSGSSFGLYSDGSCSTAAIDIYTGGRFEIGTNETALTNYLPTETGEDHATTLYLKQKTVPAGYDADIKVHSIAITKAVSTDLVEVSSVYMYVTKTTYVIVIDDKNAIDITNTKRTKDERAYGEVSVTAKDQDGAALNGLAFGLYPAQECAEKTEIATFSGQSFAISTGLDALTSHLPTEKGLENATTLYLKQTTSPAGYDADTAVHSVVITKTVKTDLDEESNTYVTTTAYGIMIDGGSAVDIINRKRTGTDRKDGCITIINKDNSGNELSGSSFGLYSDGSCSTEAIATYTGGEFTIGTKVTALINYLPTDTGTAHARTLYLKEMEAPAGYDKDISVHTLVITKSIDTYFDNTENKYITRTTYGIAVDGGSTIDIKNTKRTDEKRTYGSVVVTAKDQDGVALDGLTFGLYPAQECAENTKIATFSEQSFAISTGMNALTSYLPTETDSENATTLYLKQTAALPGYDADTVVYPVMITRSETVTLDRDANAFITMITYVITVDGGDEIVIINRKQNNTNNEENTSNAGTEGNPKSEGNGADTSSEGDGNKTNDGEDEDQTTGENGKTTTDEENGNSKASAGTQDNTTGGKDGIDSGIKTNQTGKESEKTQTSTGTASISAGENAKTGLTVQAAEADKIHKTDKSPSTTMTKTWRRRPNSGKIRAAAGERENVIADSVENGWLVSVLQEAIRILAKAVDLLSTIIRANFPAFLK